jgi:CCR4-NOT transcriptional regulation complex NOT5 subunit
MDVRDWIEQCLESLQTQKDSIEAELEVIRSKQKKNAKGPTDREVELDTLRERHNYHVSRLELTLRLLDNDNLSVDDILNVKDDVNYYIDSNQDPDFQVRSSCCVRLFRFRSVPSCSFWRYCVPAQTPIGVSGKAGPSVR